jgi:hypothetical protein
MAKKSDTIECPEYDELVAGMEAARAKVKEACAAAVGALFKKFFAEYPQVTAVGWTQYTPYFNDGEPCEFSVGDFHATTRTGVDFGQVASVYDEEEAGFQDSYAIADKDVKAGVKRLGRAKDYDLFETAFGDHVMVIATPQGFHVNEYDHD